MRIGLPDHAGFQRSALGVIVAASAVACAAALERWQRLPPETAVLAGALATLALAAAHLRVRVDALAGAAARAAAEDGAGVRALLDRALAARAAIARAVRDAGDGSLPASDRRALGRAADGASTALVELCRRRRRLVLCAAAAAAPAGRAQLEELEHRAAVTGDPTVAAAYARALTATRARMQRAAAMGTAVERIDARLAASVAELEGAALALEARTALVPGHAPAALTAACERLRAAGADLDADYEAVTELTD